MGANTVIKTAALLLILVAARASATTYTLSISTAGPTSPSLITSNPSGISCPPTCSHTYSSGTSVNLTNATASTMTFAGWGYADGCANNFPTCKVKMRADTTVTATYNPRLSLAISIAGSGLGSVTSGSGPIVCVSTGGCGGGAGQTYSFPRGTTIVLTETPSAGSSFVGWSGYGGCSTASTCTVTLNGYVAVVSTFSSAGPFTIAVKVRGRGTVVSSPPGINCGRVCSAAFTSGTSISFTTAAAAGYYFAGWTNGGCIGQTPCAITAHSAQQGLGGGASPSAFFYPLP